jgi:putative ABC transport system permease protein
MRPWARLVLRLYPKEFRRRYGIELLAAIEADRHNARFTGRGGALRFAAHTCGDLIGSACRQRSRQAAGIITKITGGGAPRLPEQQKRTEMETLLQDVRYAVRQFVRRPGFTAIAVLSLALAIGGNTLIYGLIDGFVLHPFPYPEPDRLVSVGVNFPKVSSETSYVEVLSPAEYADIRSARSFATLGAFDLGNRNISGGDVPERVFTALVLDDLFPVIGMKPALGRGFTREELAPGGPRVAIISHRLWQTRFGADPGVLNRPIRIGSESASIVGVMPTGLLLIGTDLWIPWGGDPAKMPRNVRQFTILGRLAPGAPVAQANAELEAIARRIDQAERAQFKEYEGWRLVATPWAAALLQDVRPAAFILLAAVGFVLLIACANLTNLFLARSTTRQRELAVRLALGAARWRLARQLLTESLMLAGAGAAAGLLIAYAGLNGAGALIPSQFQMLGLEARVNPRVLWFAVALAIACGVLVAIIPALQATRTDPHDSLKGEARIGSSPRGRGVRQVLVVAEIALSVLLLLGAGLLIRSFAKLQQVDPGFDSRGVLTMRLTLPRERYKSGEAITAFFERLLEGVQSTPGVTGAAMASQFPPQGPFSSQIDVEGAAAPGTKLPTANTTIVSRGFFKTLGIPLTAGRVFDERDRADGARRVVVNDAFVTRYLSGRPAVGARVRIASRDSAAPWSEIIGVVRNARNQGIALPPQPEIFVSMERGRDAWNQLFLLVRSDRPSSALLPDVRQAVRAIDPEQPVYAIQTLDEAIAVSVFQQRLAARLLAIFAAVALVLAAIGIYGVMSYSVTARTQEMGVRLAIGAQRRDVLWLVLRQVLWLSATGIAIGVGVMLAAGRLLQQLLYGVRPADPVTIVAVSAVLGAVAIAAAWAPAFRASRVDPIEALRYE